MHIYAFGSLCRGEIDAASDIDLLAIFEKDSPEIDPNRFSVYSLKRIREIWCCGNPFAWHLFAESTMLYSGDGSDPLAYLGRPAKYCCAVNDCTRFLNLLERSFVQLRAGTPSPVFELSNAFLAIRNFATCFSLGRLSAGVFSRRSPRQLGVYSLTIETNAFDVLERARMLCTRGFGNTITPAEVSIVISEYESILEWMTNLLTEITKHES